MIDLYDEVGYIKEVLEKGVSDKWERDSILLVRYYKMEGYKKAEAKKLIREKCERSQQVEYIHEVFYKRLNKIVDTAWKKEVPLRQIKEVEMPREVLEWFLGLEDVVLTDEQVESIKASRPKIVIKKNHAFNFDRIKYLFTLYIWTRVQENYLERPRVHYLKKYSRRFKEDADLKCGFNMPRERNYLFDLGYIHINYALGIEAKFMENEIFNTPITEENRVTISGEDLYKCGYWLQKQKLGSFTCQKCSKEFAHYNSTPQEKKRKYCKECALEVQGKAHKPETKYVTCIDCGEEFPTSKKDSKSCRCYECQEVHRLNYKALKQREYRQRQKTWTDQAGLLGIS